MFKKKIAMLPQLGSSLYITVWTMTEPQVESDMRT